MTPESLAALRESADILAAVCERAAVADRLRDALSTCQASNRSLARQIERLTAEREVPASFSSTATATEVGALARENRRLTEERDVARMKGLMLTGELAEARAENGRQAAVIAELLYAEVKLVRFEFNSHKTFGGAGYRRDAGHSQ